jgi:large subunit ribosomal protein L22
MTKSKHKSKSKSKSVALVYSKTKFQLMSPKKLNRIACLVRRETVDQALAILNNMPHRSAKLLYKCILSAKFNAINNSKMNETGLIIGQLLINEGPRHKRYQPRARGRMFQIIKRTSHIIVGVTEGDS